LYQGGKVEAVVEEADAAEDVLLALDGALVSALEVALCEGVGKLVGLEGVGEAFAFGGELVGGELLELFVGGAFGGALAEDALEAVGEDVDLGVEVGFGVEVASGDVEAGFFAVAGEGRVAPLAVEVFGAEDEGAVDGGALGAVGGDGVAVIEVAALQMALGRAGRYGRCRGRRGAFRRWRRRG
jgi:hypothetical protein